MRIAGWVALAFVMLPSSSGAQAPLDLNVSTPPAVILRHNMAQRQKWLLPHYESGAIGIARDGSLRMRAPEAVPPRARLALANELERENDARNDLVRELARSNGAPERSAEIRALLAAGWIAAARPGWWVQDERGHWVRK